MTKKEEFKWVIEHLDNSDDPSDWKQSIATLTFITTESYGKGVKEELLLPYLKKAVDHKNPLIQKIAVRFIISLKSFDLLSELDTTSLIESFYDKYIKRSGKVEFLKPLKIAFLNLQKEGKLQKFLEQLGQGKFTQDIVKELTSQLWYRHIRKIEECLDLISFLTKDLGIEKEDFMPVINNFINDLEDRIYLKGQNRIKKFLIQKAQNINNQ